MAIHAGLADPAEMSEAVAEAMKQEYDSLEAEPAEETIAGRNLLGFDLAFYCLDLTSTAWVSQPAGRQNHLYDLLPSRG